MAEGLSYPAPGDRTTIICLYCGKPQEIGRKALTITCKFCNKSLKLEDLAFKSYEARRGDRNLWNRHRGEKGKRRQRPDHLRRVDRPREIASVTLRAAVPCFVGPEAEIRGDVTAPTLAVGAGAVLDGQYSIG